MPVKSPSITALAALIFLSTVAHAQPCFVARAVDPPESERDDMIVVDIDDDGDADIIADGQASIVYLYESDGLPSPAFTRRVLSDLAFGGIDALATGDLDADGDIDVVYAGDNIGWFESDGTTTPAFSHNALSTPADGVKSVVVADLDGDNDLDIAYVEWSFPSTSTVAWLENDGAPDPAFTHHVLSIADNGPFDLVACDLDADNDTDLAVAVFQGDSVVWYENDGVDPPSFTRRVIASVADGAKSVFAVDVNDDGNLDLLSAWQNGNTLAWHESNGASRGRKRPRCLACLRRNHHPRSS